MRVGRSGDWTNFEWVQAPGPSRDCTLGQAGGRQAVVTTRRQLPRSTPNIEMYHN
jgi:hypothetical protein